MKTNPSYTKFYNLRIFTSNKPAITQFLERYASDYLIGWEAQDPTTAKGKRPHCHLYLETNYQSKQPITKWIKRNIGGTNATYSCETLKFPKPPALLAYMMKDGDFETTFSRATLAEAKAHDEKLKKEYLESKLKKKQEESIASFKTISAYIIKTMKLVDKETHWEIPSEYSRDFHKYLVNKVLRYYRDNSLFIREFHITSLCQTLLLKFDSNYTYTLTEKILQKL